MRLRRVRAISVIIIPVSLIAGVFSTVVGMTRAFSTLAEAESVDPSQLASDISNSLLVGVIAIPIAGIAFCVWIWTIVKLRRIGSSRESQAKAWIP